MFKELPVIRSHAHPVGITAKGIQGWRQIEQIPTWYKELQIAGSAIIHLVYPDNDSRSPANIVAGAYDIQTAEARMRALITTHLDGILCLQKQGESSMYVDLKAQQLSRYFIPQED